VFAAITVPPYGGDAAAVVAVMLYHVGNPRLLTFMYAEADVVQIALFLAIGIVTAKLADDARRLRHMSETDDLTGLLTCAASRDDLPTPWHRRVARTARWPCWCSTSIDSSR
jgi:hypothetical protein